jgi:Zn-dependent protease
LAAFTSSPEQLEQLANRARQLAALGQLHAAREHWVAILNLLPVDSPQRRGVVREIEKLDGRISPPVRKTDWKKRLGPLGILVAALAKYKTLALVLLTKGKFLISILAFVGLYWSLFGWWFALGLTGSILMHEMGHYIIIRRRGFAADLPVFIPGLFAYVKWRGQNVDPGVRAQISLAGPLFGFLSGLIAYALFRSTGQGVWLAVAQFAGWLNLLNLIPVSIFDGGSAMYALGKMDRLLILIVSVLLWWFTNEYVFLFVALGTAYRLWKRDFPAESNQGIAYYFASLVAANGLLSWFCLKQAHVVFAQPRPGHLIW